jgi:hypothetical protein
MGKRSKKNLIIDVVTAAINLGDRLNEEFSLFVESVEEARLQDVEYIQPLKKERNVMDVIVFTARLAAKVKWEDNKFLKLLAAYNYSEELNSLIALTYPLTKKTMGSTHSVVKKEDITTIVKPSESLVGDFASEEITVKESVEDEYLAYYGQDSASLEVKFNVNALGTHKQLSAQNAERMDAMVSMNLVIPKQSSVLATQYMFEFVSQLVAQSMGIYLKQSEAYKMNPEKVQADFKNYITTVSKSIIEKTKELFEKDFKFIVDHNNSADITS